MSGWLASPVAQSQFYWLKLFYSAISIKNWCQLSWAWRGPSPCCTRSRLSCCKLKFIWRMSEGWAHKHCKTPVVHKKDIKCFREEGRRGILGQGEKEVKKRCEGIVKRCGGESQARWRQLWKAVSLSPQIREQVIPPRHVCWTVNSRSRAGRGNCLPFCQYL